MLLKKIVVTMRNKEEERLQVSCVSWFDYQYPQFRQLLFAVPNGGSRNVIEAANLKKQGVRAGVSDMILLVPGIDSQFLCLEFKTTIGKQSKEQKEFENNISKYSTGEYILIRSFEEFKNYIEYYLQK
jgi:hypothetical protein